MPSKEVESSPQKDVEKFLGMSINRFKDTIEVSLKVYISKSFNYVAPNEIFFFA